MKKENFVPLILGTVGGILGILLVIGICTSLLPGVWNTFTQEVEEVVDGFSEVTDKVVDEFLTHKGESVEEVKERLAAEQLAREDEAKAEAEKRAAALWEIVGTGSNDIARASIETSLNRAKASVETSLNVAKTSVEASKNAGKQF